MSKPERAALLADLRILTRDLGLWSHLIGPSTPDWVLDAVATQVQRCNDVYARLHHYPPALRRTP